ncbi:MAG TPA: dihydroorotate dehydrogenase [Gemmatimonadaceae bacterium]|nr:dihydroorotate dehydrogenase [Gemmatimonadaceae bacterium]
MTDRLAVEVAGLNFRNPVLLAAGTAAYGRELADVVPLDLLGGLVTKAVSIEPRAGAPAPRVADFGEGMINAVGLANPGVEEVRTTELPWLAAQAPGLRVIVNVVGSTVTDFAAVVERLDDAAGANAFELNVSCPNVKAGGLEFGADESSLRDVVASVRGATRRPLFVKLSPTLSDIGRTAKAAVDAGADGISVVNTIPGLVIDTASRRPALGFGSGGVSGGGLRPVGVLATWRVSRAVRVPVMGVGGIETADHALQYILAGASLVAIGTAAMRDPRMPARVVRDLQRWCEREGIGSVAELTGAVEWR